MKPKSKSVSSQVSIMTAAIDHLMEHNKEISWNMVLSSLKRAGVESVNFDNAKLLFQKHYLETGKVERIIVANLEVYRVL